MLIAMRAAWIATTFRALVIMLLIAAIIGVTLATLGPVIYRTDWFQKKYVMTSK